MNLVRQFFLVNQKYSGQPAQFMNNVSYDVTNEPLIFSDRKHTDNFNEADYFNEQLQTEKNTVLCILQREKLLDMQSSKDGIISKIFPN